MTQRALAAIAVLVLTAAVARAAPPRGAPLPRIEVEDVGAGRMRPLPDARPVLVMYEDQAAQKQNERARAVLGRINDRAANRARFEFVAVADVEKWDWWPAKGYVLDDLKEIARRENTPLFADWKGALRRAWGFDKHQSVLVLAGADGKVRFAAQGTLSAAQLAALVGELKALGCNVD
jgi:hypothetical protein